MVIAKMPMKAAIWYLMNMPTPPVWVTSKFAIGLLMMDCLPPKPIAMMTQAVLIPSRIDPIALTMPLVREVIPA